MRNAIILFILCLVQTTKAQEPSLGWAHCQSNPQLFAYTMDMTLDSSSNIFAIGSRLPFGIFIKKLNSNGSLIWEKTLVSNPTSPRFDSRSIAFDKRGFILISGRFQNTVDFDPGPGVFNVTSNAQSGWTNAFILKLDTLGNFIWVKTFSGDGVYCNSIQLDEKYNIYTSGYFLGTNDFDPAASVFNLSAPGSTIVSQKNFLSKLDSNGTFKWVKDIGVFGASGVFGKENCIKYSKTGFLYMSGTKSNTLFVDKIDTLGNIIFDKVYSIIFDPAFGSSISLDNADNIFITGTFIGTFDFDPGSSVFNLTSAGDYDVFVTKLNSSGIFMWAIAMGSSSADVGNSSFVDGLGNINITGQYKGIADFDPSSNVYSLTATGSYDCFTAKYTSTGNFVWVKGISGTGVFDEERGWSIILDSKNNIYTGGGTHDVADFDPDAGTYIIANKGGDFIQKLSFIDTPVVINVSNKCQNSPTTKAKLLNPLLGVTKTITQDGNPLTYNQSDSTFTYFINGSTSVGSHTVRVVYTNPTTTKQKDTTYNVTAIVLPTISITGILTVNQGQSTTINTTIANGGTTPTFQWRDSTSTHNWQNIGGATNSSIIYSPTLTGDKISCILTSNENCVSPASVNSNGLSFIINTVTAINPVPTNNYGIKYFPNPTNGSLFIDSLKLSDKWQTLEIFTTDGKKALETISLSGKTKATLNLKHLQNGIYFLLLRRQDNKTLTLKIEKLM